MRNIIVLNENISQLMKYHAEYTAATKSIEMIVEGPPVFEESAAKGRIFFVPEEFADFLSKRSFAFGFDRGNA